MAGPGPQLRHPAFVAAEWAVRWGNVGLRFGSGLHERPAPDIDEAYAPLSTTSIEKLPGRGEPVRLTDATDESETEELSDASPPADSTLESADCSEAKLPVKVEISLD